ncbi:hypothetical protein ACWGLF_08835 [Streptomyces puniciscabiei]
MVTLLVACALGPLLYAAAVYAVRRRETLPPLPKPPPHRELAAPVVNLLFGRGEVTPKAIETTSLELVEAGRLRLERKADGTPTVRLTPDAEHLRHLRPFEELLLERVRHRCRGQVDRVPIEALGPGDGDEYWIWWRAFQRSVQDEALALGLIRPAREKSLTWTLRIAAGLAWAAVLYGCSQLDSDVFDVAFKATAIVTALLGLWYERFPRRPGPRLTPAGHQAAAWWCDSADATAHHPPKRQVGANGPESALPVRESRRIWSSYKKSWHIVDTAPLDRPRWGRMWQLVVLVLTACATTAVLTMTVRTAHDAAVDAVPILIGVVLAAVWLPAHRRIHEIPAELTFRGAVISRWDFTTHYDDPPTVITHYCCSIEHPESGRAWSFEVDQWRRPMFSTESNSQLEDRLTVGDVVDVHCSPRRRKIHRISVVEAVPR